MLISLGMPVVCSAQYVTKKPVSELLKMIRISQPDTNRIILFLQLGGHYLFKAGNEKADIDSSLHYYGQARQLSIALNSLKWQMEALKMEGDSYLEAEDLDSGKKKFLEVIHYYQTKGDLAKEAQIWLRFEQCIPYRHDFLNEKIICLQHVKNIYAALNEPLKEIDMLKTIADRNLNYGQLDLAETQLLQVQSRYQEIGYKKLHHVYFLLASVHRLKGNLDKELYYDLETIKSMEATADTSYRSLFYYEIARTYNNLGKYQQSLYYYLASRKILIGLGSSSRNVIYINTSEVIPILIAEKKPAEALKMTNATAKLYPPQSAFEACSLDMWLGLCYAALDQTGKAEKCYLAMMKLADEVLAVHGMTYENYVMQCRMIGAFLIGVKKYDQAAGFLNRIAVIPAGMIDISALSDIQLLLFKTDSASGKMIAAIGHFKQYKRLNDSVFNIAKSKQIEELQFKYATVQKEKELKLLQANNKLKERDLLQAGTVKRFYAFGLVMLVILLGIIYNRYRLKQRANNLLEDSQKEISAKNSSLEQLLQDNEWLLREVHHRVKNNLQIVMSLLTSQSVYLQDEAALSAVMDSQHRVQAMALIHQKLYKANNYSTIYMPDYIGDLLKYLKDSYQSKDQIYLDQLVVPVSLDVSQAVPLGLILNEAFTNAIKHAFQAAGDHVIKVVLEHTSAGMLSLTVSDNGSGFPHEKINATPNSFGLTLMQGLVDDLGGALQISRSNGTAVTVTFKMQVTNLKRAFVNDHLDGGDG